MRATRTLTAGLMLLALGALAPTCLDDDGAIVIPGLVDEVRVVTDGFGIPHISARNDLDLARVTGYVQARDRLFQMDYTRRLASGDLSELLGPGTRSSPNAIPSNLSQDIEFRTIGLRRAAQRTLARLQAPGADPVPVQILQAFADGVNLWIAEASATGKLPPEYAALEITRVRAWLPVDTLVIGKAVAAQLSLDIDAGLAEELAAFVAAGDAGGFDGATLFMEDVRRVAPMSPASTVPDATGDTPFELAQAPAVDRALLAKAVPLLSRWRQRLERSPYLAAILERPERTIGSNEWGVAGEFTDTKRPMIANDPHLALDAPSTFYEMHLLVDGATPEEDLNVNGITFPGVPVIILGQNEHITWGATTNPMDVTDLFVERLVKGNPDCPVPPPNDLCIVSGGEVLPVRLALTFYRTNRPGDGILDNVPIASLSEVPIPSSIILTVEDERRSFGPIVDVADTGIIAGVGVTETTAVVLQYTGFHATGEVETFRIWNRAKNLDDFKRGLAEFDFGSQNWAYADVEGNLAYFSSAEIPLRSDLETGQVIGLPPFFVRDGESGLNNWVYDPARSQGQSIPFAVLPFEEMPQAVNPENGFFANANNDPAGTTLDNDPLNQRRRGNPNAIYYLNPGYDEGLRAGRITQLLRDRIASGKKVSLDFLKEMQANTQQLDAELMTPFLLAAFSNASHPAAPPALAAFAADPGIVEAVERLAKWDFSTPTGIPEGWDADDPFARQRAKPKKDEVRASVAATIYNVWRAKLIRRVIDARLGQLGLGVGATDALKAVFHLLSEQPFDGKGVSGVDFFPDPAGLTAAERRDVALLGALRAALDALAGPDFANAFGGSSDQDDWRWGRLHRITFGHFFLPEFAIPPAAGFEDLSPALPGISRDGGFEVVNASGFSARADSENAFRFGGGPVRRYVGGVSKKGGFEAFNVVPGGSSADPESPLYAAQLPVWLTGDYHELGTGLPGAKGASRKASAKPSSKSSGKASKKLGKKLSRKTGERVVSDERFVPAQAP